MKFMKIALIGLIFLTVPVVSLSMAQEDLLLEAFTATGARPEAFDVTDWSVINRKFMDFSDMKHIAENVLRIFGASRKNFTSTQESDDMYRIINLKGMLDDDTHLQVIVQSVKLPEEYEKEPQTYLVVNVTGGDVEKIKVIKKKVMEAVNSSGGHSRISTCFTGSFYGKLSQIEQEEIIDKIREKLDIKEFEKMQDLEMQSFVGYSPLISDGIEIMGKNYNVNVAMRYSAVDGKTYIWMGVPVISIEY